MGVAMVGGMMASTFLTLFVVPVVYTFFSHLTNKLRRRETASTAGGAFDTKDSIPAGVDLGK